MAKRRIWALSMDGKEVHRTTTLPLTHFWQTRFTRSDGYGGGMSGFASSKEKASKAAASETKRIIKDLVRNGVVCGEPVTHIVEVREAI